MSEFKVTRYKLRVEESGKRGPDAPFSLVVLSDLHNKSYGDRNGRLLQEIREQNPAAVLVAGDMLTSGDSPQYDAAVSLMDELTKRYPVYYANGNHEQRLKGCPKKYGDSYARYSDTIRSFGVHLLENGCEHVEFWHMQVAIWGYELPLECYRRGRTRALAAGQVESALGACSPKEYNILLAHNPMYFPSYAAWGVDLTLSGHMHGGIVRLPVLGGVISPQFRLFPKYTRGLYELDGKKMIVSAGLGSHTIPLRINNPAQLVVLDIV